MEKTSLVNKKEAIILALILLIGAYFRVYRINEYMTFLGDEGRDVIVVRRLLVNFDPILIGPRTSIGDMYLGPLYYYFMAPGLFLSGYSPVGPAVQIAILGIVTIGFIWYVARKWFPSIHYVRSGQVNVGALVAAGLYAISPIVITYSISSWNPNIMPFFAFLSIYAIWRIYKQNNYNWLIVLGVSFAFVLQSHYLGLLLLPTLGIFWFLKLKVLKNKPEIKGFLGMSLLSLLLFTILMSPLVIFDARHGWRNFEAMKKFFIERQTTVSARPWNALPKVWPMIEKVSQRLLGGKDMEIGTYVAYGLVLGSGVVVLKFFKKRYNLEKLKPYLLIFSWVLFSILGLSLYKQEIYDHYYGFFFPAPFLLVGGIVNTVLENKKKGLGKPVANYVLPFFLILLIFANLVENPHKYPPNRQLQRTQEVAEKIVKESQKEKFNLAVIAERNYEDAYKYFLEWWNKPVIDIDSQQADITITNQLFVVCELPAEKCDPTHSPNAAVANFGWSKIENDWEVGGVKLYKLVHTK